MKTPYSSDNQDFTDKAHRLARAEIYPRLFNVARESIYHLDAGKAINQFLDMKMGIDRSMRVQFPSFAAPFLFTSQERFRKTSYQTFQDVTITLWNNKTDVPGELFKLAPHYFVYGFFDEERNVFREAIVLNAHQVVQQIIKGHLHYTTGDNARSVQTFACFKIEDLLQVDVVALHYKPDLLLI